VSSPAFDAATAIRDHVARIQAQQNAAIEAACERALQGGLYGVKVIRHADGTISVGVHPDVPYGTVTEQREAPGQVIG
jgi:hypothetical protein